LFLLPTLALGAARAVGPAGATTQTANSAAGNIPTAAGDGVSLKGQCLVSVQICAASGQTLSGGGTAVFWWLNETAVAPATAPVWSTLVEGTNPALTSASGLRCVIIATREVAPFGRLYVEADTVTASGGSLTVNMQTTSCDERTEAPSGPSGGVFAILSMARATILAQPMLPAGGGGIAGVTSSGSVATTTVPFRGPNGSAATPTWSFTNFTNTGMYAAAGTLNFAVAGSNPLILSATSIVPLVKFESVVGTGAAPGLTFGGDNDTGLSAAAANTLVLSAGGAGATLTTAEFGTASTVYLRTGVAAAGAPTATDCDNDAEIGRTAVDTTNERYYVCNGAARGWDYVALTD
jgi:hypothetical protein